METGQIELENFAIPTLIDNKVKEFIQKANMPPNMIFLGWHEFTEMFKLKLLSIRNITRGEEVFAISSYKGVDVMCLNHKTYIGVGICI